MIDVFESRIEHIRQTREGGPMTMTRGVGKRGVSQGDQIRVVKSCWYAMKDGELCQVTEHSDFEDALLDVIPRKGLYGGRAFWGPHCANAVTPVGQVETMSTSGGPFKGGIDADLLVFDRVGQVTFWRWKDVPRAGGGEHYGREVAFWILPALHDYRLDGVCGCGAARTE